MKVQIKKILVTLAAVVGIIGAGSAQGINNVRINEVLVLNENNYMDGYGHRSSWVELFNSGYELVNVAQCYLEVTRADGSTTRYQIPKDPATAMHSQTYLLFFCEGTGTKGTFYTNFTLENAVSLKLYNSGGKEVISEFPIDPTAQLADVSVGWMSPDGVAPDKLASLPQTTPGATNETLATVSKDELYRQRDSSGGVMAIIAMSVVFSALLLIFFVLKGFGAVMMSLGRRKEAKAAAAETAPVAKRKPAGEQVAEEMAAVGLALKLFQEEQHIRESTVITINRASRVYSPWSSKIHGIPAVPPKK